MTAAPISASAAGLATVTSAGTVLDTWFPEPRLGAPEGAQAGTTRLGVRTRMTSDPDRLVVVYPWRDRHRAQALGTAVVAVLDGLGPDLVAEQAASDQAADEAEVPLAARVTSLTECIRGTRNRFRQLNEGG